MNLTRQTQNWLITLSLAIIILIGGMSNDRTLQFIALLTIIGLFCVGIVYAIRFFTRGNTN
jgi:hypothetical protein